METEGVIKFNVIRYKKASPLKYSDIAELNEWRRILYNNSLIGQDNNGDGYGNVSRRLPLYNAPKNKRAFIITKSQTGHLEELTKEHYTIVFEYYPEKNGVIPLCTKSFFRSINPSSESMTHGSLYDIDENIRFIFHAHSEEIWNYAKKLDIPITKKEVKYGTPEMAREVRRIYKEAKNKGIFSMGGHENGIITFGRNADEAGSTMLKYLVDARCNNV